MVPEGDLDRRSVLKMTTGAASVLAVGGVAASGTALAGRQGGRALVDGTVRQDRPFTVRETDESPTELNASCMSGKSADQTYRIYEVSYCPEDSNPCLMYVHPDEAPVNPDEVYQFRSQKQCKANDLVKASFGPSNQEC